MNVPVYLEYLSSLNFRDDDLVCMSFGGPEEKAWANYFQPFCALRTEATIQKLIQRNNGGQNIYISMAPFLPGTTTREKQFVAGVRHVFADQDRNGAETLARIEKDVEAGLVPEPAVGIESSPGKIQVIWHVNGDFDIAKQETTNRAIQTRYNTDPNTVDTARVLRVAGTTNHKYESKPEAGILARGALKAHSFVDFKIESPRSESRVAPRDENNLIPHGYIHDQLVSQCGKFAQMGMPAGDALEEALVAWAAFNCAPPLDLDHVRQVARSTDSWKRGNPLAETPLHGGVPAGTNPDVSAPNNDGEENKVITDPEEAKKFMASLGIRDYNSLLTGNLKDGRKPWIFQNVQRPREVPNKTTEWILDRMIMLGGLHVFSSLPGGEKSILSLVLTKTIASGEGLFARKNSGRSRHVVVLDRENPPSVVYERLRGLGFMDLENVFVWGEWDEKAGPCPESFDDPRLVECARIIGEDVLFVADSLSAFSEGKDENSVQEMNPIVRKALRLARMSGGVILLHHTDKGGNFGRGTVAIRANADMAFLMDKNGEVVTIGAERFRPCPVWTLKFEMDWGGTTGVFTPKLISDSLAPSTSAQSAEPSLEDMKKRVAKEQAEATRRHYIEAARTKIQEAYDAALAGTGNPISNRNQLATLIGLDPTGKMARTLLNGAESNPWECVKGERSAIVYLPKGVKEIPPKDWAKKRAEAEMMFGEKRTIEAVSEALSLPEGTVRRWRTEWGAR